MHKALVVLTSALGVLGVVAAAVAIPAGMALLSPLERTLHAGSYRPALFVVAWAAYRPGTERRAEDYWAVGTVDGHRERLGLAGTLSGIHGWDELEAQVRPGQSLRVLYDPSLARAASDAGSRVIAYEDDFASRQRARLARRAALVFGPSLMLLAASLVVGAAARRPPLGTAAVTALVLAFGVVAPFVARGGAAGAGGDAWRSRMGTLFALALGAAAAGIGAAVWHTLGDRKQRARGLRRRSARIGFEFLGDAPDAAAETEALGPFPLFQRGVQPRYDNRMRGVADGYEVLLLDYTPSAAHGGGLTSRTVVRLGSLSLRLPVFTLVPSPGADEGADPASGAIVRFPAHPRFSQAYVLRGPDPSAIEAAFPATTIAFFEAHPGWSVESLADRLLVHRAETVPPARLDAFLADVLRVAGVLHGRPS